MDRCTSQPYYAPAYSILEGSSERIHADSRGHLPADEVLVNGVDPGCVRKEMAGPSAPRSPQEGADTIVWCCRTMGRPRDSSEAAAPLKRILRIRRAWRPVPVGCAYRRRRPPSAIPMPPIMAPRHLAAGHLRIDDPTVGLTLVGSTVRPYSAAFGHAVRSLR